MSSLRMIVVAIVVVAAACSRRARPSEADCDRAGAQAAKLVDPGFAEQQTQVAGQLATLCKDPKQGWTKSQVECVLAAKTASAFKQCAE